MLAISDICAATSSASFRSWEILFSGRETSVHTNCKLRCLTNCRNVQLVLPVFKKDVFVSHGKSLFVGVVVCFAVFVCGETQIWLGDWTSAKPEEKKSHQAVVQLYSRAAKVGGVLAQVKMKLAGLILSLKSQLQKFELAVVSNCFTVLIDCRWWFDSPLVRK